MSIKSTAYIARDFLRRVPGAYVFPIKAQRKKPPCFKNELQLAFNDEAAIDKWGATGCNWGVALQKSGLIVPDVDRKPGKSGTATELDLMMAGKEFPPTLTVRTPSGGSHFYYKATAAVRHQMRVNGFGSGIDSTNYTVIPGCRLDGSDKGDIAGKYTIINDAPVTPAPDWFADVLGTPSDAPSVEQEPVVDLDQDANIAWFREWLRTDAPPSIMFCGGGDVLVKKIAPMGKDHGLSRQAVKEILSEPGGYNETKCNPPWELSDDSDNGLFKKVDNGFDYCTEEKPGSKTPEAQFADTPIDDAAVTAAVKSHEAHHDNLLKQIAALSKQAGVTPRPADLPGIGHNSKNGIEYLDAEKVETHNVDYIWFGRLARGKHTLIAGESGEGKSQIVCSVVAKCTRGADWPDAKSLPKEWRSAPKGTCIILSAEDDPEDTLVPRLRAAGADLTKVKIVQMVKGKDGKRKFNLENDIPKLEEMCKSFGDVVLITIDPVSSYMGGKVQSGANSQTRHVLDPLSDLAAALRCAILSVTHFRKGNGEGGPKAVHKIIDSIAFGAAPRATFGAFPDPTDIGEVIGVERRLFLPFQSNLPDRAKGLAYHIVETWDGGVDKRTGKTIKALRIEWDGDTDMTADTVNRLENEQRSAPRLQEATDYLEMAMADGPRPVKEVKQEAAKLGIKEDTLRKARDRLGIKARILADSATKDQPGTWEYYREE